jgi:hypothetical protein
MIREFFQKLVTRAKEVATALKARFTALAQKLRPHITAQAYPVPVLSPKTEHALNLGKRYRLTSDHSPVFSLFTFFPDRR